MMRQRDDARVGRPRASVDGKRMAEAAARRSPPPRRPARTAERRRGVASAVVLKPGAVYGTRYTKGGTRSARARARARLVGAHGGAERGERAPPRCPPCSRALSCRRRDVGASPRPLPQGATADEYAGKVTVLDSFALRRA